MILETWLHDDIQDYEIVPPNYKITRKDSGPSGGSVAMAIEKDLECHKLGDVNNRESVWVRLNFCGTWLILGTVYRRPGSTFDDLQEIQSFLMANANSYSKIIIRSDFNFPNVNWSEICANASMTTVTNVLQISFGFNLIQVISEPTQVTNDTCSVFDLLFLSSYFNPTDLVKIVPIAGNLGTEFVDNFFLY